MLSATLPVVAAHAGSRQVFYSSFDPDVCLELCKRQSSFPVGRHPCPATARPLLLAAAEAGGAHGWAG